MTIAGPKHIATPIGIAKILQNLSITGGRVGGRRRKVKPVF
jgi:hypothetical protein